MKFSRKNWKLRIYFSNFMSSFIRASQSVVFNGGQKMALRAFYFIRALTKALIHYYINRSQRHLLVAIENNRFGGPILWDKNFFMKVIKKRNSIIFVKGTKWAFASSWYFWKQVFYRYVNFLSKFNRRFCKKSQKWRPPTEFGWKLFDIMLWCLIF